MQRHQAAGAMPLMDAYVAIARPRGAVLIRGNVVTAELEEVVDPVVAGEEALGVPGRLEALHLPLSSSRRLVRVLDAIVQSLVPTVLDTPA